jgi:monofunctional biosynthetic peptidoglycan transglycosylase
VTDDRFALPDEPIAPGPRPRERRNLFYRIGWWIGRGIIYFVALSVIWVFVCRYVPPPVTVTMLGDLVAGNGIDKDWMSIDTMDPDMARAAIAGEDAKFCSHNGFDTEAMMNAFKRNAKSKRLRGGSTISQQTAKNVFLWQGSGYTRWLRKVPEFWFTALIETIWGKKRIMEVYLNVAETGIGTYGANAGAMRYFGHDASTLSRQEAARIAAVLPLPKKRAAIDPGGFTRRYGNAIAARSGVVQRDRLDVCVR